MSKTMKVCSEIMRYLVERGYTKQVHQGKVTEAIVFVRGADTRTLVNWTRALVTLGYLKKRSARLYDMDLKRCPELLVSLVRGEKQKRLM